MALLPYLVVSETTVSDNNILLVSDNTKTPSVLRMALTMWNSSASSELLCKIRNSSDEEFLVMPPLPGWVSKPSGSFCKHLN